MSSDSAWYRHDAAARRLTLTLHVQPGARKSGIVGLHGDALKVKIAARAADNKANTELIACLSDWLRVPKSAITIRHGATSRRKIVEIAGDQELVVRVANLLAA